MSLARVLVSIGGKIGSLNFIRIGPLNFISFNRTDS
jgi:hypothetical protein